MRKTHVQSPFLSDSLSTTINAPQRSLSSCPHSSAPPQSTKLSFSALFSAQMASPMSKQLGDFLQEHQEPFAMEVYLHERGYPRSNSAQFLKGSASFDPKKRRKSLPSCSKIMGAVFSRIVHSEANRKFKNCWSNKNGRNKQDLAEDDHFSSASSSTVFNSCSQSDAEDEGCKGEEEQVNIFNLKNTINVF